ncbi:RNA-binding domain-containing protein [Neocallimastix sp. 'constans']|jgi:RNA recognition motif-containing protein
MAWNPMNMQQQYPVYAKPEQNTLWMGDLENWMDENFLKGAWYSLGEQVNVKIIHDKMTGQAGYCFVEFSSPMAAQNALATFNRTLIPGTNRYFKLNWATGGANGKKEEKVPEYSIFVGDLAPEVNDALLTATFQARYVSCKTGKVILNPVTGLSKGYGFVRFTDESEQQRAMTEMQGQYCGSAPIRIMPATTLKSKILASGGNISASQLNLYQPTPLYNQHNDPNNTTVFVGNLSPSTTEDELRAYFQPFGEIIYVKISTNKACGFIQYFHRHDAENAVQQMAGSIIDGQKVKVSWGHTQMIDPKTVQNIDPAVFQSQQYPFLNNFNTERFSNTLYGQSTQPLTEQSQVLTEDTFPPSTVEKMNELYLYDKESSIDQQLSFAFNP